MIFSPINEKSHKRDKLEYINNDIDISDKEYHLPMPPLDFIMHQHTSPSCVAHAVTMAVMVAINMQTNKWVKLSPFSMQAYLNHRGGGTQPWYIAEVLCRFGILPKRDFRSSGDNPALHDKLAKLIKENPIIEQIANHYKGIAYAELRNFDDVKRAIKAGYPVIGSVKTDGSFGKRSGGYEPMYPMGTKETYHAIEFNGWCEKDGKEYLIAINSYGKQNGNGGKVYIPRGRMINELTLIDFDASHIKSKADKVAFHIGAPRAKVDFEFKDFDVIPYIKNNRTFVPVRFVAECLGADVSWNAIEGKATIESEEAVIILRTNSKIMTIDGNNKKMDVAPEIVNDRMMLPIRYVAEALNCFVEWNDSDYKAVIYAI